MTSCCAPSSDAPQPDGGGRRPALTSGDPWGTGVVRAAMVALRGGVFRMGTAGSAGYPADGEAPVHEVELSAFSMGACTVTNRDFAEFVAVTGHRTQAERDGWSFVFGGLLPDDFPDTRGVVATPWWRQVEGADWNHPEGRATNVADRADHPVVHVSWHDAAAFCAWSGTRLPTEAEWEYAARGGLHDCAFPWGDDLEPGGEHRMNVFQGTFPGHDTGADGYVGTAPVDAFEPNGYGLWNMTGNVWEWCSDWFDPRTYQHSPRRDPQGPGSGTARVMRGGSYLCHESYCRRYRVSARSANTPDSSAGNIGFRVVADPA